MMRDMRDNEINQSQPAYEDRPTEGLKPPKMPPNKQFGNGNPMPQNSKSHDKAHHDLLKARHKEHR